MNRTSLITNPILTNWRETTSSARKDSSLTTSTPTSLWRYWQPAIFYSFWNLFPPLKFQVSLCKLSYAIRCPFPPIVFNLTFSTRQGFQFSIYVHFSMSAWDGSSSSPLLPAQSMRSRTRSWPVTPRASAKSSWMSSEPHSTTLTGFAIHGFFLFE